MAEKEREIPKSEILFLYESKFSQPNGDPFTNEQRYDEATKAILVSDVRIKRFIRDYLDALGHPILVRPPKSESDGGPKVGVTGNTSRQAETGMSRRFQEAKREHPKMADRDVLLQYTDARLFGAVVTTKSAPKSRLPGAGDGQADEEKTGRAFNETGPVQFALLNPSLNQVDLRPHQNTSVLVSRIGKGQGAIATTSVVPFALNQIHGWVNPFSAKRTRLKVGDIDHMLSALWHSINGANTRSKCNQDSLLLLQIIYANPEKKIYGLDRLIQLVPKDGKRQDQVRCFDDYNLDLTKLLSEAKKEFVKEVLYYTDSETLKTKLQVCEKFQPMTLVSCEKTDRQNSGA